MSVILTVILHGDTQTIDCPLRRLSNAGHFARWARRAAYDAPRLAVVVHLHYPDLWPEIESLIAGWRRRPRLFVSLTRAAPELGAQIAARFPGAQVRVMENRGRDVRPFLVWLEDGALDGFDLVCKIHGKRSLGGARLAAFGDLMRRAIFLDLIASADTVERILARFAAEPKLGLVGSRRYRSASVDARSVDVLGPNRPTVEALARRLGAPIVGPQFDFFEGTMFWARPQALQPLAALRLARDAFAPESGGLEGQLEHALERIFNHAVRAAGYEVAAAAVDDPG